MRIERVIRLDHRPMARPIALFLSIARRAIQILHKEPSRLLDVLRPAGSVKQLRDIIERHQRKLRRKARQQNRELAFAEWSKDGGIATHPERNYDAYLDRQRSKLSKLNVNADFRDERLAHFRAIVPELVLCRPSCVLCLAARTGEEVQAFIEAGHFAVGIDLNPGPENSFVVAGDFHALQYASNSVDCIFTNSLDHAFDLAKIASEAARVLKPGGIFVAIAMLGYEEGKHPGEYEWTHWATARVLAETLCSAGPFWLEDERKVLAYPLFMLRKPIEAVISEERTSGKS